MTIQHLVPSLLSMRLKRTIVLYFALIALASPRLETTYVEDHLAP